MKASLVSRRTVVRGLAVITAVVTIHVVAVVTGLIFMDEAVTTSRQFTGVGAVVGVHTIAVITSFDLHLLMAVTAASGRTVDETGIVLKIVAIIAVFDARLGMAIATSSLSCLLYTSPSPRDQRGTRMPSSA